MHHFLHYEAMRRAEGYRPLVRLQSFAEREMAVLDSAIRFYQKELIDLDLRRSSYMENFHEWIRLQQGKQLRAAPLPFRSHVAQLNAVADIYRRRYWPKHQAEIGQLLRRNWDALLSIEESLRDSLSLLCRQNWQSTLIRVDLVRYGKSSRRNIRDRPYSRIEPARVVLYTDDEPMGNWLELLFHEASHHLILSSEGFVAGTIADVAATMDAQAPRSLWHAYLFYFTGRLLEGVFEDSDYTMYMKRNAVFDRYFPHLQAHLPSYMRGERTLAEVTREIISGFQ